MIILKLNEEQIKNYSQQISANREFFAKEENKIKEELSTQRTQEASKKTEIRNLGTVEPPGASPDAEDFLSPVQWVIYPYIIGLILLFLFHCVIWVVKLLFDIPWDTWGWTKWFFWFGLIAIAAIYAVALAIYGIKYWLWNKQSNRYYTWKVTKERLESELGNTENDIEKSCNSLRQIEQNREDVLLFAFQNYLNFPIKSFKKGWPYKKAKQIYLQNRHSLEVLRSTRREGSATMSDILQYFNQKYKLFYTYSLQAEATSNSVLRKFQEYCPEEKDENVYRGDVAPIEIGVQNISSLKRRDKQFGANRLDDYIDCFNEILEMDTSGFFTKHDSSLLEEQVSDMQSVYNDIVTVVKSYNGLVSEINMALGICRLVSYRNIYLGSELLNILRENGGGGKATTANDSIQNNIVKDLDELDLVHFSSSESVKDIIINGLDGMTTFIENGLSDKSYRKYAMKNPKEAAMLTLAAGAFSAISAGIDAWKQRNAKIEGLLQKEKEIIEGMNQMVDNYNDQVCFAKRGIEIIEALTKVNNGLMEIYKPLYDKVFIQQDVKSVTIVEQQQLALALMEYNKLSKTKL